MSTTADLVLTPAKAIRLSDMMLSLLDELHEATERDVMDDIARARLAAIYGAALVEIGSSVSDPLLDELSTLMTPIVDGASSLDEVRVAMAQLSGWILGLLVATTEGLIAMCIPTPPEERANEHGEPT